MRILTKCGACHKFRLFTRPWYYQHFIAGTIHDKEENPKCYWCYRKLQRTLDNMNRPIEEAIDRIFEV